MQIRKNDKVKILTGKDRGKTGKVLQVFTKKGKISVEEVNLKAKHLRPRKEREKGQRIQFPAPIDISNVMLVCPKCNRPTRVGVRILDNKKRHRVCKKCKELI